LVGMGILQHAVCYSFGLVESLQLVAVWLAAAALSLSFHCTPVPFLYCFSSEHCCIAAVLLLYHCVLQSVVGLYHSRAAR
jgi:hypothetical protein